MLNVVRRMRSRDTFLVLKRCLEAVQHFPKVFSTFWQNI